MRIVLKLHDPWPSRNVLDKWHWRKRHQYRKDIEDELGGEFNASPQAVAWRNFGRPFFRKIELYRVGGIKDRDNLIGGAKAILDALGPKGIGVIEDDSDDKIEVTYYQGGKYDRTIDGIVNFEFPMSGSYIVLSEPD